MLKPSHKDCLKPYCFLPGLVGVCLFPLRDQFDEVWEHCYTAVLSAGAVVPCFPVPASLKISLLPAHIEDTSLPLQTWQMARNSVPTETMVLILLALSCFNFSAKGLWLHLLHSSALHCTQVRVSPETKYMRLSPCTTSLAWMTVCSCISSWLLVISSWDIRCCASNRLDSRVSFTDLHVVNIERMSFLLLTCSGSYSSKKWFIIPTPENGKWVVWKFMNIKHICATLNSKAGLSKGMPRF